MNRHQKFNKRPGNSRKKFIISGGVLLVLLLVLWSTLGARILSGGVAGTAAPFWKTGNFFQEQASGLSLIFTSKQTLESENKNLKSQVATLKENLSGFDSLVQENLELKKILGRSTEAEGEKILLAGVLAHARNLPYDTLNIDAGTKLGVKTGDFVFERLAIDARDGEIPVIIGTVQETYNASSKVKLFSTAGEKTDVFLGPQNIPTILEGMGGGTFQAELPKEADVQKGDVATFPGVGGYLVAVVEEVGNDPTQAFLKVRLRTFFNPFELHYVGIRNNPAN